MVVQIQKAKLGQITIPSRDNGEIELPEGNHICCAMPILAESLKFVEGSEHLLNYVHPIRYCIQMELEKQWFRTPQDDLLRDQQLF